MTSPMQKARQKPTVADLCGEHRNEEPHASHVAALAVRIFDAVRALFNLPKGDRLLLEMAARLHDIGYADAPADHVRTGVDILRKRGLAGFTDAQVDRIAAVMALHGPLDSPLITDIMPARPRESERLFRLGAILRVADGLDHGHLQECRIADIRHEEGLIRLYAEAPPYSTAIDRAMSKSELWQRVFPIGLAVEHKAVDPPPEPLPDTPAREALRRLMLMQFRIIRMNMRRAARDEEDDEALHDLRIAVRSLRRLLEAFERPLRKTSAAEVQEALRNFAKRLGPARDFDVWWLILQRRRFQEALEGAPDYLEEQAQQRRRLRAELRAFLNDSESQALVHRVGYLLRIELPNTDDRRLLRPFGPLIRRRVRRAWLAVLRKKKWAKSGDAELLHGLRVRVRKLRLLAFLTRHALAPGADYLIESAHEIERNLGRLHDLDLALQRASATGAPAALTALLVRRRRKELRQFRKRWKEWSRKRSRQLCREAWRRD